MAAVALVCVAYDAESASMYSVINSAERTRPDANERNKGEVEVLCTVATVEVKPTRVATVSSVPVKSAAGIPGAVSAGEDTTADSASNSTARLGVPVVKAEEEVVVGVLE